MRKDTFDPAARRISRESLPCTEWQDCRTSPSTGASADAAVGANIAAGAAKADDADVSATNDGTLQRTMPEHGVGEVILGSPPSLVSEEEAPPQYPCGDSLAPPPNQQQQQQQQQPHQQLAKYTGSPFQLRSPVGTNGRMPENGIGEWTKCEVLGRGAHGVVYRAVTSQGSIAVKQIQTNGMSRSELQAAENEIRMLPRLRHPNVVRFLGIEQVEHHLNIFLEYLDEGSLRKRLDREGRMSEAEAAHVTGKVLAGLAYLHSQNITHRDIKGANVLLSRNGAVKVADFGTSKLMGQESIVSGLKGTPHWMAPEVIRNQQQGHRGWVQADVWSVGCTVLEMLTGKTPWPDYPNPMAALFNIATGGTPPVDREVSDEARSFIGACCCRDPAKRHTVAQLMKHPFLALRKSARTSTGAAEPSSSSREALAARRHYAASADPTIAVGDEGWLNDPPFTRCGGPESRPGSRDVSRPGSRDSGGGCSHFGGEEAAADDKSGHYRAFVEGTQGSANAEQRTASRRPACRSRETAHTTAPHWRSKMAPASHWGIANCEDVDGDELRSQANSGPSSRRMDGRDGRVDGMHKARPPPLLSVVSGAEGVSPGAQNPRSWQGRQPQAEKGASARDGLWPRFLTTVFAKHAASPQNESPPSPWSPLTCQLPHTAAPSAPISNGEAPPAYSSLPRRGTGSDGSVMAPAIGGESKLAPEPGMSREEQTVMAANMLVQQQQQQQHFLERRNGSMPRSDFSWGCFPLSSNEGPSCDVSRVDDDQQPHHRLDAGCSPTPAMPRAVDRLKRGDRACRSFSAYDSPIITSPVTQWRKSLFGGLRLDAPASSEADGSGRRPSGSCKTSSITSSSWADSGCGSPLPRQACGYVSSPQAVRRAAKEELKELEGCMGNRTRPDDAFSGDCGKTDRQHRLNGKSSGLRRRRANSMPQSLRTKSAGALGKLPPIEVGGASGTGAGGGAASAGGGGGNPTDGGSGRCERYSGIVAGMRLITSAPTVVRSSPLSAGAMARGDAVAESAKVPFLEASSVRQDVPPEGVHEGLSAGHGTPSSEQAYPGCSTASVDLDCSRSTTAGAGDVGAFGNTRVTTAKGGNALLPPVGLAPMVAMTNAMTPGLTSTPQGLYTPEGRRSESERASGGGFHCGGVCDDLGGASSNGGSFYRASPSPLTKSRFRGGSYLRPNFASPSCAGQLRRAPPQITTPLANASFALSPQTQAAGSRGSSAAAMPSSTETVLTPPPPYSSQVNRVGW